MLLGWVVARWMLLGWVVARWMLLGWVVARWMLVSAVASDWSHASILHGEQDGRVVGFFIVFHLPAVSLVTVLEWA